MEDNLIVSTSGSGADRNYNSYTIGTRIYDCAATYRSVSPYLHSELSLSERLRYEIDPRWYGELPRTYFHAADGSVTAVSGLLDPHQVERWIASQHPRD